ncbi:MAG: aldehyde dehydrogenase family protein, partial [Terriglobales bacterium]
MATKTVSPRALSDAERDLAAELVARARRALAAIAPLDQAAVDRLCRALAWATANESTAARLAHFSVDETGMG